MKKYLLILFALFVGCASTPGLEQRVTALEDQLLMLQAGEVGAVTKMYGRDCALTSTCAKAMDAIPGAKDSDTRCAIFNDNKLTAWYWYDPTSGAAASYPDVVDDLTQGGDERWILGKGAILTGNIQFPFSDPSNMPTHLTRGDQSFLTWRNRTGLTLNIQEIRCESDLNGYQFLLLKSASATDISTANDTQIDSVTTDTAGTGCWTKTVTSGFDSGAIEDGKYLIFQHVSGVAKQGLCEIKGYLN